MTPMADRSRFAGFRFVGRRILRQNGTGLFRIPLPRQALRHGVDRGFELLAVGFAQRRLRAAIDDLVQFFQVHLDRPSPRHIWLRYSRKRGVKGKPRTSLIGRFGLLVWSFLPRPVVSPSSCQFAAR
jgi:hypothetical protein